MSTSSKVPNAARDDRPRDPSLDALADMPNRVGRGLTVALYVRGAIVVGELISERQFFDEQEALVERLLAAQHVELPDAEGAAAPTPAAPRAARPGGMGRRAVDAPDEVGEPTFVHLRRARVIRPGGSEAEVGPRASVLWRGRVDAVDGYSILEPMRPDK
jgi:hypothetical protein